MAFCWFEPFIFLIDKGNFDFTGFNAYLVRCTKTSETFGMTGRYLFFY